jgi:hypothetical protein
VEEKIESRMTIQLSPARTIRVAEMPAQEVDVELLTFVERYATNLARWDVLVFFGRNPTARDNALGIAQQIGRRAHIIEKELNDLVYLGILRARDLGGGMQYELARLPGTRRTVMRLARRTDA